MTLTDLDEEQNRNDDSTTDRSQLNHLYIYIYIVEERKTVKVPMNGGLELETVTMLKRLALIGTVESSSRHVSGNEAQ